MSGNISDEDRDVKSLIFLLTFGLASTCFASTELNKSDIQKLQNNQQVKELGCSKFESVNLKSLNGKEIEVQDDRFSGAKVLDDSTLVCKVFDNQIEENKAILYVSEIGMIKGVDVEIPHALFASSSGGGRNKGGWDILCNKDGIDDTITCYAISGHLFVFSNGKDYDVVIGAKKDTNKDSYLRIDKNKALVSKNDGRFDDKDSQQAIEQMKNSDSALIRFTKPGEDFPTDEKIDLESFPAAIEVLDLMRASYK